jgi:hypothetical protein
MLDAEEAEARVRDAVEKTKSEAQRRSRSAPAAGELQARREAEHARREAERARRAEERARRRGEQREREAEELPARSTTFHPKTHELPRDEPRRPVRAEAKHVDAAFTVEETAWSETLPGLEPVTKQERRSAKEAARVLAALEKREARERKALAKAAAKRRLTGTYRA